MEAKRKSVDSQECLHPNQRRSMVSCTGKPVHDLVGVKRKSDSPRRTMLSCTGKPVHDLVEVKKKSDVSQDASQACLHRRRTMEIVHWETSTRFGGSEELRLRRVASCLFKQQVVVPNTIKLLFGFLIS